ncbi:Putative disease resistance protein RGA3 [Linum perenne]
MAEIALIPVAKQILSKLTELGSGQIELLWTLEGELVKLKNTVSTIQAVLLDAEEKQTHSRQVKDWLEKLSEAMYDADDLLDDFSTEAACRDQAATNCWSVVCFLVSTFPKRLMYGLKMASDIKAVRERLDAIRKDKEFFHLEVRSSEECFVRSRETDSCPPTIVVGREADKERIIQLLLNVDCGRSSSRNVTVAPIVGIGGLGKTTLAQLVFYDDQVKAHYEVKGWVYVSQSFDIRTILEKMLQSVTGESQADLSLDVMRGKLQEEIRGKRFLFALDDVWEDDVESWEALVKHLNVGSFGSNVLVTTRSREVADVASRVGGAALPPYLLQGLSLDESWNLMSKRVNCGEVLRNPDVERIGKEILMKCHGVPLAVATVAGLLGSRNPETEWSSFLRDEIWSISEERNPIMSTLRLSFEHLPSHLKHCFSYCKIFPKGHELCVPKLVQLWTAQGYIEQGYRGLECFKTLWCRSFFHEVEIDQFGNIAKCRMHDLLHDLAASVAGERILIGSASTVLKKSTLKTRHLTVLENNDEEEEATGETDLLDVNKVRTLLFSGNVSREGAKKVLKDFRRLRVLAISIEDSDASKLLHSLGDLKHLRFLVFGGTIKIPNSVTNLVNLQVLDLSQCSTLEELPRDIKKLVNLKYLDLNPYSWPVGLTRMPKGFGELASLHTLTKFVACNDEAAGGLIELKGLKSLRGDLMIVNLEKAESIDVYALKNKPLLQFLVLDWANFCWTNLFGPYVTSSTNDEVVMEMLCPHHNLRRMDIYHYGGVKFPEWLSFITNLAEISLLFCSECEYLPPLHRLPYLKKLIIAHCPKLKGIDEEEEEDPWPYFPCLASFSVSGCPNLTRMPAFPNLELELELKDTSAEPLAQTMKPPSSSIAKPLSRLVELSFEEASDLESIPEDGFSSLVSLEVIRISKHHGLELPNWLCSAMTVKEINLRKCRDLEYLPDLHQLPSLRKLLIHSCPNLKGWWNHPRNDGSSLQEEEWPQFRCLSRLYILDCPNLTQMPLFPAVETGLELIRTSSMPLIRTMMMKMTTKEVAALSKLTYLDLRELNDLEYLPEEGVRNLGSLRVMVIVSCPRLGSLPRAMQELASLQKLKIERCPQLAERCREGLGEDWPNISQVTEIQLD